MLKNKPMIIFIVILIAIIIVAISVVASVYNKNKLVVPDNSIDVISSNDMFKIKAAYEAQGKKQEFLELCGKIELAVANKLLDGTVTNDQELAEAIQDINTVLSTDDWKYLGLQASNYWMGTWNVDANGALKFSFKDVNIKPNWANDEDVVQYIK